MKKIIVFSGLSLLLFSCAHHRDVRPGAEGVHYISVQGNDMESGSRDAISQANHFCEQRGKTAAFTQEEKKYTGDMDESNYKMARRLGTAAQVVGSGVGVLGSPRSRPIGGVVGLGGAATNTAIADGYTIDMKFKCI